MTQQWRLRGARVPEGARRWGLLVLLAVLAVVGFLTRQTAPTRLPLDPDSAGATGTKALTLILEEGAGADVEVFSGAPTEEFDTILVLVDNVSADTADRLRAHVDDGGVLVVTDAEGRLTPQLRSTAVPRTGFEVIERGCDVPALQDAANVEVGGEPLLNVPSGATGCYGEGRLSWLVVQPQAAGTIVVTGGPTWLTNRGIREADNVVLAAVLLAPHSGTRVGILRPEFAPAGAPRTRDRQTLVDLIPTPVKLAFAQLLVAFALMVLWRARRLGSPVSEPQPVRLAGSELVTAVGNLLRRTGSRARAADVLRTELRGLLGRRFGGAAGDDSTRLAETVAAHAGTDPAAIREVLDGADPRNDEELVLFAQRTESILHAVAVPPAAGEQRVDNE